MKEADGRNDAIKARSADGGGGGGGPGDGAAASDGADGAKHDPLRPELQGRLGEKLREVYSDVINEPVPDRFLELLDRLDNPGTGKAGSGEDGE